MRPTSILAVCALALGLLAAPAAAQSPIAPGQQIQISADSLVIAEGDKQATFTGNVVITRTGLTVHARTVTIVYGSGIDDIQSFDARDNVRIETAGQVATGQRAVFDPRTQMLRLTGNVLVENAAGTMGAAALTVDLETNHTVFEAGEGKRVTGVFTPQ